MLLDRFGEGLWGGEQPFLQQHRDEVGGASLGVATGCPSARLGVLGQFQVCPAFGLRVADVQVVNDTGRETR
jgi:hypothetical protein